MRRKLNLVKLILLIIIFIIVMYIYLRAFIYKTDYMEYIKKYTQDTNIDPYFVLSIIKVESNFNSNAISNKNAKGLMQIRELTSAEVNNGINSDLYDPETNIRIGITYFNRLLKIYDNNYYIALLAYNGGMGNVNSWIQKGIIPTDLNTSVGNNIPFKETKNYLKKVISTYNIYNVLY